MNCSRCGSSATIKQGNQWLCDKHYRFGQMRSTARRHGKEVPSHELLEAIAETGMKCPDCSVAMNWRAKDGQATVASLQHYRSGEMGIVCRTCNTRHAFMPGDEYCEMDKGNKLCPGCGLVKHLSMFTVDNSRSGLAKRKSHCKSCSDSAASQWRNENRERYNEYQRDYRAKRKS